MKRHALAAFTFLAVLAVAHDRGARYRPDERESGSCDRLKDEPPAEKIAGSPGAPDSSYGQLPLGGICGRIDFLAGLVFRQIGRQGPEAFTSLP
jgi:hypothetical protein